MDTTALYNVTLKLKGYDDIHTFSESSSWTLTRRHLVRAILFTMVIAFHEACVHQHTSQDKTPIVLLSPHQRSGQEYIPIHGHISSTINQRIQSVCSGKDQGFDGKSGSQV